MVLAKFCSPQQSDSSFNQPLLDLHWPDIGTLGFWLQHLVRIMTCVGGVQEVMGTLAIGERDVISWDKYVRFTPTKPLVTQT